MRRRTSVVGDLSFRNLRSAERNCSCSSVNANWIRRAGLSVDSSDTVMALKRCSAGYGDYRLMPRPGSGGQMTARAVNDVRGPLFEFYRDTVRRRGQTKDASRVSRSEPLRVETRHRPSD